MAGGSLAVAENAAQIRDLGQELHRRLGELLWRIWPKSAAPWRRRGGLQRRRGLARAAGFASGAPLPELGVTADAPLATPEPIESTGAQPVGAAVRAPRRPAPLARRRLAVTRHVRKA